MPTEVKVHKSLSEMQMSIHNRVRIQKWIDKGEGIAIYVLHGDMNEVSRKYCSFGQPLSAIPNCDYPPNIMPRIHKTAKKDSDYRLVGYIPKKKEFIKGKP